MGFVLIPNIGVSNINIAVTITLVIMSIIAREKKDKKYFLFVIELIVLQAAAFRAAGSLRNGDFLLCRRRFRHRRFQ